MLSAEFLEVKKIRSCGNLGAAVALLQTAEITSDDDAFESAICLFIAGDHAGALKSIGQRRWNSGWGIKASAALDGMILGKDPREALSLARLAISETGAGYDCIAIHLILLRMTGLIHEAAVYVRANMQPPPTGEILLLTAIGEIAIATQDWPCAYSAAAAIFASDPNNFRALVFSSIANYESGNVHESLGNAIRANRTGQKLPVITLQLMRCQNQLGDHYAAVAAFSEMGKDAPVGAEIYEQLGIAHSGLGSQQQAVDAYRRALGQGRALIVAIRNLLEIHISLGAAAEVEELVRQYGTEIHQDVDCVTLLGLDRLNQRDRGASFDLFRESLHLTMEQEIPLHSLGWPVPEPRLRHDCEQLELLEQRNKLPTGAKPALAVLKHYLQLSAGASGNVPAPGRDAEALAHALGDFHYCPDLPFSGAALGENDFRTIEEAYFANSPSLVVIDNFLSGPALSNLRQFCEEATVWKAHYKNGYAGAFLSGGFGPRVLLAIADELRQAMPKVVGENVLTQAWAFKYDQRLQGINLHADFARVNVNFWITPDEACLDKSTGGMVIYDVPAPKHWTFENYNANSSKIEAFIKTQGAKSHRVPYRENRCVLFDSTLFHTTDELHFKPGYSKRRVNITFLYGKARNFN
ncbi:MAG: hypothetical protein NTW47_12490 [Proteobacteria bacterium]|nr:hypothetical protein [Pseudomonadota bacterium]